MLKSSVEHYEQPRMHKYPCLGVNSWGMIVLFTSAKVGTVVSLGGEEQRKHIHKLGEHYRHWETDAFFPLPRCATVHLHNDNFFGARE